MIDVCCAIISESKRLLVVKRSSKSNNPLKWEFPGGKVLINETPEQCIIREIKEELNIEIKILRKLIPVEHYNGKIDIRLIPFECIISGGKMLLTEHSDFEWFEFDDYLKYDWLEADIKILEANKHLIKKDSILEC